jgi:hypothetical protein
MIFRMRVRESFGPKVNAGTHRNDGRFLPACQSAAGSMRDGDRQVGFADQDGIALLGEESAAGEVTH